MTRTVPESVGVVLLGASNLTLGWSSLLTQVEQRLRTPVRILTAHGMGRSWMAESRFGWRVVPGILQCGLWDALRDSPHRPPGVALITDLGNDLVYNRPAASVAEAAGETVKRLREHSPDCRIVMTRPPMQSIETLSGFRFRLYRTILFPFCRLSLATLQEAARELDQRLAELPGVEIVEQPGRWFGLDPIHIRRSRRHEAFADMLRRWPVPAKHEALPQSIIPVRRPTMAERHVFGRLRMTAQPCITVHGSTVAAW